MEQSVRAYAKINITLDIVNKMPDGYHEMKMIMESVSLYDDIRIRAEKGEGVKVKTNLPYLPNDDRNIAAKAARLFLETMDISGYTILIDIKKKVPVSAGMAGGSSDAAAVLRGMNELFGTQLKAKELEKMGEALGSDVPYCVCGGTVLATGRGEKLKKLKPIPRCHIVICKPNFSVSTPELFKRIKWDKIKHRPDTEGVIECISKSDINGIAHRMYNVFEDVSYKGRQEIMDIKAVMIDVGALGAAMSGTGPTVFGIFDNRSKAETVRRILRRSYRDTFLVNNIKEINV